MSPLMLRGYAARPHMERWQIGFAGAKATPPVRANIFGKLEWEGAQVALHEST